MLKRTVSMVENTDSAEIESGINWRSLQDGEFVGRGRKVTSSR